MRYEPKVGDEFPVRDVKESRRYLTEVTRSTIAICVVVAGVLSLLVAAAIGTYQDDFGLLRTLWEVIGFPLGLIVAYYFRGSEQGDEDHKSEDHKSTA
jgi:hypothetical protein